MPACGFISCDRDNCTPGYHEPGVTRRTEPYTMTDPAENHMSGDPAEAAADALDALVDALPIGGTTKPELRLVVMLVRAGQDVGEAVNNVRDAVNAGYQRLSA